MVFLGLMSDGFVEEGDRPERLLLECFGRLAFVFQQKVTGAYAPDDDVEEVVDGGGGPQPLIPQGD